MKYETAKQASERLGVTVRTVQKWACIGKIPGAYKLGKAWLIPAGVLLENSQDVKYENVICENKNPIPLLNASFEPGKCLEYINSIEDDKEKNLLMSEYFYEKGKYIDSEKIQLAFFASLYEMHEMSELFQYVFISKNHEKCVENNKWDTVLHSKIEKTFLMLESKYDKAVCCIFKNIFGSFWPGYVSNIPALEEYIKYLPEGLKLFGYYLISKKAYQNGEYEKGVVIAEMGIISVLGQYPVPLIYAHIIAAVNLVNLFKIKEAKRHIMEAWNIACKDGIIQPFGEHYGVLMGLIEAVFKKKEPETYKKIVDIYSYFGKLVNSKTKFSNNSLLLDELTPLEYIIAMMFSKNWKVKEIADQIEMSERSIKSYLQSVYQKMGINSRKELKGYF